tara:strand:- start:906 stop:1331 length:426 start_codon:yes stop_codon:yes gene_type:complete
MNIDSLISQMKSEDELKAFINSQFKQILQLTKQIKDLETKLSESKEKVKQNNNLAVISQSTSLDNPLDLSIPAEDSKVIAQVQLKMIKELSFERELTLEEAKKVQIFNEILKVKEEKPVTLKANAKVLQDTDLLTLVNGSK